jgi:hypothetical protein
MIAFLFWWLCASLLGVGIWGAVGADRRQRGIDGTGTDFDRWSREVPR